MLRDKQRALDYLADLEFFAKVALTCTFFQWLFSAALGDAPRSLSFDILLYWTVGLVPFYAWGLLVEKGLKRIPWLVRRRSVRSDAVKPQPFVFGSWRQMVRGSLRSLIVSAVLLLLLREVHRPVHVGWSFAFFFLQIVSADLLFYVVHRALHRRDFVKFHRTHHEYRDTSGFVAGHKSLVELIVVTASDIFVLMLLGFDFPQLLAWTLVGTLYNIEGHSGLSLFFISTNFHDRHHTRYLENYGIIGLLDRAFGTCITNRRKGGLFFPTYAIGRLLFGDQILEGGDDSVITRARKIEPK